MATKVILVNGKPTCSACKNVVPAGFHRQFRCTDCREPLDWSDILPVDPLRTCSRSPDVIKTWEEEVAAKRWLYG